MLGSPQHRLTKGIGLLLGACLAAFALHSWQVAGGSGTLAADVQVEVHRTGQLDVAPVGRFLVARSMTPGARSARASFSLRNRTTSPLRVALRARPSIPDLDRLLELRVDADGHELFGGTLGSLRRWTRAPLALGSLGTGRVTVSAWLPRGAHGYEARRDHLVLELRAQEA